MARAGRFGSVGMGGGIHYNGLEYNLKAGAQETIESR